MPIDFQPIEKSQAATIDFKPVDFQPEDTVAKIKNPLVSAVKAASDFVPGTLFATQYWKARLSGLSSGDAMMKAKEIVEPIESAKIEGLPAQLSYGATAVAPIVAGAATPFVSGASKIMSAGSKLPVIGRILASKIAQGAAGFGAYEGARHLVGGDIEGVAPAIQEGLAGGAAFGVGGKVGATATQPLKRIIGKKIAERVGSAAGAATTSAIMAPEGEKISSAMLGGAFGAKYPSEPIKGKSAPQLKAEATSIYRNMLRPSQGEVKKIEVGMKKNINDYYQLAAEEQLPIKRTSDNKLDTKTAQEVLSEKVSNIHDHLGSLLKGSNKKFNLERIGRKAKQEAGKFTKNAKELKTIESQIDEYIDAEIQRNGSRIVDATTFNKIKQGMWSVGYDALKPTSKRSANLIGHEIKNTIERSFKEADIKGLNELSGKYQTLEILLQNADGRVIKGGRLGSYVARMLGGLTGGLAGQVIPIPGVGPAAGAVVGQEAGAKIANKLSSPERAVKRASSKIKRAKRIEE